MPKNDPSNNMGHPEPLDASGAQKILDVVVTVLAIAGGLVVVPALLMPSRTSGASHASKVKWQQRQCEVDQAIAAQASGVTGTNTNGASTASENK